jgi:enterochelin esterase-like enzyme
MRWLRLSVMCLMLTLSGTARAADDYKLGPDSIARHEGVPKGRVEKFEWKSTIYPGTVRDVWVYVPSQYDGKKPACVMVFQDGMGYVSVSEKGEWRVPFVFDNLIAAKEMPVTVGIFLNPGNDPVKNPPATTKPAPGSKPRPKYSNRSFEYDSLGDQYARFLLEEILPEVSKRYNLKLTSDPEGRAIAGGSSGGICAFTVAWERPNEFRKVFSVVGSFTRIRGGDKYPEMVRSSEKKPIRVFMQDGTEDLNNEYGSWVAANQKMADALKEKAYDLQFVVGHGKHSSNHGASIFPDVLRWLWRDYKAKE